MSIIVKRKKLKLGLLYGMVAGMAFSLFAWGIDAFLLARANYTFWWIKFIPGLLLCTLCGGLAGWLTIRFERHAIALGLWSLLAVLYSWLVVWIPFTGSPSFIKSLDPNLALYFNYSRVENVTQYQWVSLAVIGLASILCGLLEINLVSQASVSTHGLSSFAAIVICIFLFGVAGSAADQMVSVPLREPVQVVNNLLQFAAENEGADVPVQTARKMHLSAARHLSGLLQKDYQLTLIGFDENIGMVDILVDYEGTLVRCAAIFSQPTDCIILTPNP